MRDDGACRQADGIECGAHVFEGSAHERSVHNVSFICQIGTHLRLPGDRDRLRSQLTDNALPPIETGVVSPRGQVSVEDRTRPKQTPSVKVDAS